MTANALVQTRINGVVKDEAAAVLATMGLTVSDAVRIMLTRVAHDKALPFEPLRPTTETIAAMRASMAALHAVAGPEMSMDEVNAEIKAYRREKRAAGTQ
jgi:DNA-damage-inducible protein J